MSDLFGVDLTEAGSKLNGKVQELGDGGCQVWGAGDNGMVVVVFGKHCGGGVVPVSWEGNSIEDTVCMESFEDGICAAQQGYLGRVYTPG